MAGIQQSIDFQYPYLRDQKFCVIAQCSTGTQMYVQRLGTRPAGTQLARLDQRDFPGVVSDNQISNIAFLLQVITSCDFVKRLSLHRVKHKNVRSVSERMHADKLENTSLKGQCMELTQAPMQDSTLFYKCRVHMMKYPLLLRYVTQYQQTRPSLQDISSPDMMSAIVTRRKYASGQTKTLWSVNSTIVTRQRPATCIDVYYTDIKSRTLSQ